MGHVFEAQGPPPHTRVALKVLHADHLQNRSEHPYKARLLREADILRRIQHPNVLPVYDVGQAHGQVYVVMHLVVGVNLATWRRQAPRHWRDLLQICVAAGRGLSAAHRRGVIHRDIKPGNILVGDDGGVWLADFGLAQVRDLDALKLDGASTISMAALTRSGIVMGTPAYMAPEQHLGGTTDAHTDQFALCVTIFECLYDTRPFEGETLQAVALAACTGQLKPPPNDLIPRALYDALAQGMAPAPQDRHASIDALLEVLDRVLTQETPTSHQVITPRTNYEPLQDTFVGRAPLLAKLAATLTEGARLISLVGPAGAGKTRLAREFGLHFTAQTQSQTILCDLAEARDADDAVLVMMRALGAVATTRDPLQQLINLLKSLNDPLLILDNVERLTQPISALLNGELMSMTRARFLLTSREALGIHDEHPLPVEPLRPPSAEASPRDVIENDAVALFAARARQVQRDFQIGPHNAPQVAQVVRLLDGLPLALELAAARLPVLNLSGLCDRLDEQLRLLRQSDRLSPLRHVSLRAALDISWETLTPWQRSALAQASVFEGGFTLEDAEAVISLPADDLHDALEALDALMHRSLLKASTAPSGQQRFFMLTSVQAYAAAQLDALGLRAATIERHLAHFATFGDHAMTEALHTHGGAARFARLQEARDNLDAALRRALKLDALTQASALAHALSELFERHGPTIAGADRLETLITRMQGHPALRARLLERRGRLLGIGGDFKQARDDLQRALDVARAEGEHALEGRCLGFLAQASNQGTEDVDAMLSRALEIADMEGDRRLEGIWRGHQGIVLRRSGRESDAMQRFEEARAIAAEVGDARYEGMWLANLGIGHFKLSDTQASRRCMDKSLEMFQTLSDRRGEGNVLTYLGAIHRREGSLEAARRRYEEALRVARVVGNHSTERFIYGNLGKICCMQGWFDEALRHLHRALELSDAAEDHRCKLIQTVVLGDLEIARRDSEAAQRRYEEAQALSQRHGLNTFHHYALAGLAEVALMRGELNEASAYVEQALTEVRAQRDRHNTGEWLRLRADIERQGHRHDAARRSLDESEATLREVRAPYELARALVTRVALSLDTQDLHTARRAMDEAQALLQRLELAATSPLRQSSRALFERHRALTAAPQGA